MQPSVDLPYCTRTVKDKQYAYTRLPDGSRPSLGRAGTPQSWHRLAALRRQLEGSDRPLPPATHEETLTVAELAEQFLRHEIGRSERGGITRTTLLHQRGVVHTLVEAHAATLVTEFGPKALKSIQQRLRSTPCRNDSGRHRGNPNPPTLSTGEVNRRINTIRTIFRWGVSEELVPPTTLQALESVRGLRRGDAHENPERTAVPVEHVERVLDAIRSDVKALILSDPERAENLAALADTIEFLRWTGCRPGEACRLRWCDLDLASEPPVAVLHDHKTAKSTGRPRVIPLNAKTIRLLTTRISTSTNEKDIPVFSLRDRTGHRPPTSNTLFQIVRKYCKRAGVPHWTPYQIRHLVASAIVNETGSEATAAALLGHTATSRVVQRYSKERLALAQAGAETLARL